MSEDTDTQAPKAAPIQTLRDGAIVVKLWRQEGENGPFVSATLGRTYQDKQSGAYRESQSFGASDVLKAQALLGEASREIIKWRESFKQERQEQNQEPELPIEPPAQGLSAQRDAALAAAKQPARASAPERNPER